MFWCRIHFGGATPGAAEGCGRHFGCKTLIVVTRRGQAAVMAPGDFGLMGRATCKTCKIPCREEEGLLGDRQLLGGAGEVGWGQIPTSASLLQGRILPHNSSCQGVFGVCFFPMKAFALAFQGGLVLGQFWAFPTFSFTLHPNIAFSCCFSLRLCVPLNGLA